MNRLIRTPTRSPIRIIPQIDIQPLPRTYIPRTLIRPIHPSNTPLQIIAAKCKRAVGVFALGECYGERHVVDDAGFVYNGVEQFDRVAGGGNELDELARDNLELAG